MPHKDSQVIRAYSTFEFKAMPGDANKKRRFTGIASTPSTDSMGDVVEPLGMEIKLPTPLLWQHRSNEPIGWVTAARKTSKGVEVDCEVAEVDPADSPELAAEINKRWAQLKTGLVRGLSIGFESVEAEILKGGTGIHYIKTRLKELSTVTIAANSDCSLANIKSADTAILSKSGVGRAIRQDAASPPGGKQSPGVSGASKQAAVGGLFSSPKGNKTMATIADRIKEINEKRVQLIEQKSAAVNSVLVEQARPFDDAESEQDAQFAAEIKQCDDALATLKSHEKFMVSKAAAVTADTGRDVADGRGQGAVHTKGGIVSFKSNVQPGVRFTRFALAMAQAKGNPMMAQRIAAERFKDTPEVSAALEAAVSLGGTSELATKAAVPFGTGSDASFAGPLVQYSDFEREFVEMLRPATIMGKMTQLTRVPFMMRTARQLTGAQGSFVGEGLPKPVGKQTYDNATVGYAKVAVIVVLTDELVRFSSPNAEMKARDDMVQGIATYIDKRFMDRTFAGVANVSPASITNPVTPIAASGTTLAAIDVDVRAALAMFATSDLDPSSAVWVMPPAVALRLSMKRNAYDEKAFPELSMLGGTWYGIPVIVSNSMASSGSPLDLQIALVTQREVFLAEDPSVSIDMSQEASVQMNDTPSAGAQSLVSLWANNLTGIRVERMINWAPRRIGSLGIALIDGVNY